MKVELHLHTNRYSGCAANTPSEMMQRLIETGYGAVFITEHNAIWCEDELTDLRGMFPEIRIFGGVELSIRAQHLLVLGATDPRYLGMTDEAEVLDAAREAGFPTILAHPFRWDGGADMLGKNLLPDAIEHLTCNQHDFPADLAVHATERGHLPLVNAGDVHSIRMIDKFWIETISPVEDRRDIRRIIVEGTYRNCSG